MCSTRESRVACVVGLFVAVLALGAGPVTAATPGAPQPVSPGARSASAVAEARCPTFSWAGVDGAPGYQIAVFRIPADPTAEPALETRVSVPANAVAWTPPVGSCLERGARYAWSVAAAPNGLAADGLQWSAPFLFEVEAAPSSDELEQAIATIERHLRTVAGSERTALSAADTTPPSGVRQRESHARPLLAREEAPASPQLRAVSDASRAGGATTRHVASLTTPPELGPASLTVSQQIHLAAASDFFKAGSVFLWDDAVAGNTALGRNALASIDNSDATVGPALGRTALSATTISGPAFGTYNTAVGTGALYSNEYGFQNTAVGFEALRANYLGLQNTATGFGALRNNTGDNNTATGAYALHDNTEGGRNTAVGKWALANNTTASNNTATGFLALYKNTTGVYNTATGVEAMENNVGGNSNAALGRRALRANTDGIENTAIGYEALLSNTTGDRNIAIGRRAGSSILSGNNNIVIGNLGANESGVIRIGTHIDPVPPNMPIHTATFIAGIHSQLVDNASDLPVFVDSAGKLGTGPTVSARRFKQDIEDLGPLADRLLDLRPVAFRYREHAAANPDGPRQFGLIAEEVAEILPELVVFDADGKPGAVKYHLLSSLLLGELQRQHEMLERQHAENLDMRKRLQALEVRARD